jgi:hypothetical protein
VTSSSSHFLCSLFRSDLLLLHWHTEIRVDAWKLCQLMRRAEPRSAEDIGTWQSILEITSIFAIFINSALVAFTATNMVRMQYSCVCCTLVYCVLR